MDLFYLALECSAAKYMEVAGMCDKSFHFCFRDKATPGLHYLVVADRAFVQRILLYASTNEMKCLELEEKMMRLIHRNARIIHQEGNPMLLIKKS